MTPHDGRPKVFVSYSLKDENFAKHLVADLQENNIPVWFGGQALNPGDSIIDSIGKGLTSSDYLLVLLSNESIKSKWVQFEVNTFLTKAIATEKRFDLVIPVLIEDCELPIVLRQNLYVDFRGFRDPNIYARGLAQLIKVFIQEFTDNAPPGLHIYAAQEHEPACEEKLRDLTGGELRRRIAAAMSREEIEVLWGDVFGERLNDELPQVGKDKCVVELILRCKEKQKFVELLRELCQARPKMGNAI